MWNRSSHGCIEHAACTLCHCCRPPSVSCNAAVSFLCVRKRLASYHPQRALAGSGLQRILAPAIAAITSSRCSQHFVAKVPNTANQTAQACLVTSFDRKLLSGRCRRGVGNSADRTSHWQHSIPSDPQPEHSPAELKMLFGSPLSHLPNSLQDAVHLALSPSRTGLQSGNFSPSPFHLFHSPPGATLDDSPYQSLTRPVVKHSPVSAAAQHTAVQASRQAAVGQAQGQRGDAQNISRSADALERTSTAMLIPMSAAGVSKSKVAANSTEIICLIV